MGYYDHDPTILLGRPLALIGFFGAGVVATAMAMGADTGLNPVDLDALVAHRTGHHPRAQAFPGGRTALREQQVKALERSLSDRPFGVLALPWDLIGDPRARSLLQAQATTCYVQRDLLTLYARVLDGMERDRRRYPALGEQRPTSSHDLTPLLAPLRPFYEACDLTIPARALHPSEVAMLIEARLTPAQEPRAFSPR